MKVFKFGGASVKDASSIKRVAQLLEMQNDGALLLVISAMGKTTNALERLVNAYMQQDENQMQAELESIRTYHMHIAQELAGDGQAAWLNDLHNTFVEIEWMLEDAPSQTYDMHYDQLVSMGELLSTKLISGYLNSCGMPVKWVDARDLIQTDNTYREAKVDWEASAQQVRKHLSHLKNVPQAMVLTQGFIGGTSENFTTTLGREGSDYSAAILAYLLDAESVTIWKDVPGVLNADPRYFAETTLLPRLSYQDAIELAYYGATVIHPKTIKPLQNKNIPLLVKSFLHPEQQGTCIQNETPGTAIPCFILKQHQVLISLSPKDFSFVVEEQLRDVFEIFSKYRVKVNLMQHSAISFSCCCDVDADKMEQLLSELKTRFKVRYNQELELLTIRNYSDSLIETHTHGCEVFLEQKSRNNVQIVRKQR